MRPRLAWALEAPISTARTCRSRRFEGYAKVSDGRSRGGPASRDCEERERSDEQRRAGCANRPHRRTPLSGARTGFAITQPARERQGGEGPLLRPGTRRAVVRFGMAWVIAPRMIPRREGGASTPQFR